MACGRPGGIRAPTRAQVGVALAGQRHTVSWHIWAGGAAPLVRPPCHRCARCPTTLPRRPSLAPHAGFERDGPHNGESPAARPPRPLPDHLKPLLEECRPLYALLRRRALRPLRAPSVPLPLGDGDDGHADGKAVANGAGVGGTAAASGPSVGEWREGAAAAQAGGPRGSSAVQRPKGGTHAYEADSRNDNVLIGMRDGVTGGVAQHRQQGGGGQTGVPGRMRMPSSAPPACFSPLPPFSTPRLRPSPGDFELVWRPEAKVSVFDSGFMLGVSEPRPCLRDRHAPRVQPGGWACASRCSGTTHHPPKICATSCVNWCSPPCGDGNAALFVVPRLPAGRSLGGHAAAPRHPHVRAGEGGLGGVG